MAMLASSPAGDLLDQDVLRRVVIQRDPIAVHGAEEGTSAANLPNQGGFTESELAHPLAKMGIAGQLTNAADFSSGKLAEGEEFGGSAGHGD